MPSARVSIRIRACVLLAAFVIGAPSVLAEPPELLPVAEPVIVTPNDVAAVIARPPAPIELVESGGGYVAPGGIRTRLEPRAATLPPIRTYRSV